MINRIYRFHGHNSLSYLFKNGKVERAELMSLKFVKSKKDDYRLSVIVSKKVSKSAVVRNRIRRRLYEIVRLERKASIQNWPYDMAITVYDEKIAGLPHEDLKKQVQKLLQKTKITI